MSLACAGMLFACNSETTPAESGSAAPTSSVKASGSTTKVSSSAAKKIKVTFNYNYQGAPDATVKTAGADGKVTLPANPEKEDAEFKEWNTKADGTGTKVTADNIWEADATVYAIWIEAYGAPTARAGSLTAAPYETPSASASSVVSMAQSTKTRTPMTKVPTSSMRSLLRKPSPRPTFTSPLPGTPRPRPIGPKKMATPPKAMKRTARANGIVQTIVGASRSTAPLLN